MDSISEFISQQDKIKELEKRLSESELEKERWRARYLDLASKHSKKHKAKNKSPKTRTEKAVDLIKSKSADCLAGIADECSLSAGYVRHLSSKVNRGLL